MPEQQVHNWFGNITSRPRVVVEPESVEEIVAILGDGDRFPSPVRAVGSNRSTTPCGVADGGTLVVMRKLDSILSIGPDTVTVQAGALYIDVAKELQRHGLQFYVNVELGNLTMGSAACGGTKDASMPGECGQVGSYAVGIKLVTPAGERLEITEAQSELLHAARSSYGLFGIIYEVTFRVRPLAAMAVQHRLYSLDEFARRLPALKEQGQSLMLYLFPFLDRVAVEFRRYHENDDPGRLMSWQWRFRNWVWSVFAPRFCHTVSSRVPLPALRDAILDRFDRLLGAVLVYAIHGRNTIPTDQQIRYPATSDSSRYTFSIWAFPEEEYVDVLRAYFQFCRDHYRRTGYRCDMLNVGYRISADDHSLFSYSFRGTVITADPVSTGNPGWDEFLVAYNAFCSGRDGVPLFNQTAHLTRAQVEAAFGERVDTFRRYRRRYDPADRLVNAYFRELLG